MIKISTNKMNPKGKRILLTGLLAIATTCAINAAFTSSFYKKKSLLSEGKWVKVGVEKTGVYEISYAALEQMGFKDPAKVSIYGRGGRVLSESFVSNSGVPVITDDVTPVKILHDNNKIYFYGLGPEEITFVSSSNYPQGGYFSRVSNNIYTTKGYYFLTDTQPIESMEPKSYNSANIVDKGVSYVYHELDSLHNSTNSGQLFWGELVGVPGSPHRSWAVEMPDAITGDAVMQCEFYIQPDNGWNYAGSPKVSYGFENAEYFTTDYKENTALYYAPHQPTVAPIKIPGNTGNVFVEFSNAPDMSDYTNLDFWVVSYQSNIPTLKGVNGESLSQSIIALPEIAKNNVAEIQFKDASSIVVLDVTNVTEPQVLASTQQGNVTSVGVKNSSKTPVLAVFDKNKPQLQISGYEDSYNDITNQDLHSYKDEGADFIIITTPALKYYADQIADLHREYDGIKVVVATTEECYNEFSGGTPDPMAYRSFAKMLYFSERKPKNILLFGPLYGDFRGIRSEHNPNDGIIAYQSPSISVARGAHNINDFYGMMSDKFRTDYYERNDVQIGVGILPVKFTSDAQIVVDKIRHYLKRDDHAYYLNKFTGIGGLGDDHTHDIQVRDINNHIRNLDNLSTIFTPLAIDTYGNSEARKKFLNQLNEGCNMFSYFGHGAEQFLGKDKNFFNAGDVYTLRNQTQSFALFGGCQITNTDRGFRGLGETIVTSTPYGCIGSIVSARDTWSGQNYEFFKQFFICLYTQGSTVSSAKRTSPVTIGEVYASVKNYSTYSNELAYQLLCDPAIVLPAINRTIKMTNPSSSATLAPGDKMSISGTINNFDGSVDKNFNGQVVVRLNEPEKVIPAGMIETKQNPKNLSYTYRDEQVSMMVADVKNGAFSIDIHVPSALSTFEGQNALLYFCAYDPSTKVGAGSCENIKVGKANASTAESGDNIPPVIEALTFDASDCSIFLTVSDNVALNMSTSPLNKGLYLYIDGRERSEAHFAEPVLESTRPAFSKNIIFDGISYGEHTARIKVKDAAGNTSEKEIFFTYEPPRAKYSIVRDSESGPDATTIRLEGATPERYSLVVLSAAGDEVWRGELQGSTIVWNHEYSNGSKVPAGHYKAYIIETGTGTLKGHSEPIDIPVI